MMFRFPIGAVVYRDNKKAGLDENWGHVTGFTKNGFGETIVRVLWDTGYEYAVHPDGLRTQT